jgi:phosphate transport system substrate-binding protein
MLKIRNLLKRPVRSLGIAAVAGCATFLASQAAWAQVQVDDELPTYKKAGDVSGSIKSVGSDTLNNLMTLWAERFNDYYPNVAVEIEGKGSSTAPPALIEGTSQLGPMSREMKASEIDEFEKRFGYEPMKIRTAVDALAVFVHKDNPVESLSLEQVKQIFSVDGKDGITWGDVGVTDAAWKDKPISLYGRNSASGTYGYFKDAALGKADYKASVKEQPGSSSVVQGVASDRFSIGYSGFGYKTADVKAVPLDGVEANIESAYSGEYPLARFLYVYLNVAPSEQPSPVVREFVKLIFSQEGQQVVIKDGYFPVTSFVAQQDLEMLNIAK